LATDRNVFSRVSKEQTLAAIEDACGASAKSGYVSRSRRRRWLMPEHVDHGVQPGDVHTRGGGVLPGLRRLA
jgi:hypothetical protein